MNRTQPESLRSRWAHFAGTLLDPWLLFFLAITAALSYRATQANGAIEIAPLAVLVAASSAVLGAHVARRWDAMSEQRAIVARGRASVRGLKLLLTGIAELERRTCAFLSRQPEPQKGQHPEPLTVGLEDIAARCRSLAEETLGAIESWTDVIPEADIQTQIGVISELSATGDALTRDLAQLKGRLESSANRSGEDTKALRAEIAAKEGELKRTRRNLAAKLSATVFSPAYAYQPGWLLNSDVRPSHVSLTRSCSSCGKSFPVTLGDALRFGPERETCPDCAAPTT